VLDEAHGRFANSEYFRRPLLRFAVAPHGTNAANVIFL
jgi:hypothetical protein